MNNRITCPNCQTQIEITEVISTQLRASIRDELETELGLVRQKLKQQQEDLAKKQQELQEKVQAVEEQVEAKLAAERPVLEQAIRQRLREEQDLELKDKAAVIAELQAKVQEATAKELIFLKEKRELQEKARNVDLEVERRLQEQLQAVREQAAKDMEEQQKLKLMESEQKVQTLLKQIEDLKRRAEQGSQQAQGEVLEIALEELLKGLFPTDAIEPVPKGVRGADVVQRVFDDSGLDCGLILWESKRTRHWSKDWLPKLRDDLRMVGASRSVIVSEQLPEHIRHFGQVDGVWVASWACVHPVAVMLRESLIGVAKSRRALDGQHGKMELVYNYLTGQEFCNRVSGIAEAFVTMRQDLEREKQVFQTQWNKRAKQLERVLLNTTGLYGDLQGIIGSTLPEIRGMGLSALDESPGGVKVLPEGNDVNPQNQ
ncbi:MAG TPA: DUF2130 domain-containing protein [Sedimentisphaerales bacterium]|nr:DUF2130 domain-containing protein [Sedimentisphaerales bacterium]